MTSGVDFAALMQKVGSQLEDLPVGVPFDVVVKKAEAGMTSTDRPQIKVTFTIESGPHAGRPLYNNFVITEENQNALVFFFGNMKNLGLDANYFQNKPPLERVAQDLVNRRARVTVTGYREYGGKKYPNLGPIQPAVGGAGAPAPVGPGGLGGGVPMPSPAAPIPAPVSPPAPTVPPVQDLMQSAPPSPSSPPAATEQVENSAPQATTPEPTPAPQQEPQAPAAPPAPTPPASTAPAAPVGGPPPVPF